MKITLSKSQWEVIGNEAGWIREVNAGFEGAKTTYNHVEEEERLSNLFGNDAVDKALQALSTSTNPEFNYQKWVKNELDLKEFESYVQEIFNRDRFSQNRFR